MAEGEVRRLNIDGAPLGEALAVPSSRQNIAAEVAANNFLESEEILEKKIAHLTHVHNLPKSTVVMNDSSNVCIEVSNVPVSTLVHEHVNYSLSTNVDFTEEKKT